MMKKEGLTAMTAFGGLGKVKKRLRIKRFEALKKRCGCLCFSRGRKMVYAPFYEVRARAFSGKAKQPLVTTPTFMQFLRCGCCLPEASRTFAFFIRNSATFALLFAFSDTRRVSKTINLCAFFPRLRNCWRLGIE